jgi:hypothetical protein
MDLGDLKSWGRHWNDAAMDRIADVLPRRAPSRTWPLLGMLALGLVAGAAIGGYAVSQRSHMKRLSDYAHRMGDELSGLDTDEDNPVAVTTHRSNHRRKATTEV